MLKAMSVKKMKISLLMILFLLMIFAGLGWNLTARAAYESAEYKVIEKDGDIEIREYPDLVLVSTESQSTFQGSDGSFMRLFRYISGDNAGKQKVAMTTPVFMEGEEGETNSATGRMSFVVPKQVADRGAPQPTSPDVRLQTREGGRFAVIRFSGRMNEQSAKRASQRLLDWVSQRQLKTEGEVEYAGYDPPWTPGPMRRNEVLIRLAP